MGIKETPTKIRDYYNLMHARETIRVERANKEKKKLEENIKVRYDSVRENVESLKTNFNFDVNKYKEFTENKYTTGLFLKAAKGLFINRGNDYELVSEVYDVYKLAQLQKSLDELEKEIVKHEKLVKLTFKEYKEILRTFYTEVHKQLILEGKGYPFVGHMGWICINRVVLSKNKRKQMLDFDATRKRKAELQAQGIQIYNKEEADWCLRNGIEYKAVDHRVFKHDEYFYEIPLLKSYKVEGQKLRLTVADYRSGEVRGKTNDQLIEECNGDTKKICELKIDLKTKLTLCDKVDKLLYTKFIRNEKQTSYFFAEANS